MPKKGIEFDLIPTTDSPEELKFKPTGGVKIEVFKSPAVEAASGDRGQEESQTFQGEGLRLKLRVPEHLRHDVLPIIDDLRSDVGERGYALRYSLSKKRTTRDNIRRFYRRRG